MPAKYDPRGGGSWGCPDYKTIDGKNTYATSLCYPPATTTTSRKSTVATLATTTTAAPPPKPQNCPRCDNTGLDGKPTSGHCQRPVSAGVTVCVEAVLKTDERTRITEWTCIIGFTLCDDVTTMQATTQATAAAATTVDPATAIATAAAATTVDPPTAIATAAAATTVDPATVTSTATATSTGMAADGTSGIESTVPLKQGPEGEHSDHGNGAGTTHAVRSNTFAILQ